MTSSAILGIGNIGKKMKGLNMKKLLFCTVALTGLLAASLRAGPVTEYKQVAPPPPLMYGLGFYGAIDMGANVYQNRGGDQHFSSDNDGDPWDRDLRFF